MGGWVGGWVGGHTRAIVLGVGLYLSCRTLLSREAVSCQNVCSEMENSYHCLIGFLGCFFFPPFIFLYQPCKIVGIFFFPGEKK